MPNPYFEKIEIDDYRLCKNCQFKPDKYLSTLIGPNGSGKTTILRGIHLLNQLRQDTYAYRRSRVDEDIQPTRIKVGINIDGKSIIHTTDLWINTDENNEDAIIRSRQKWYMRDITGNRKYFNMPLSIASEYAEYKQFYLREDNNRLIYHHFVDAINTNMLKQEPVMQTISKVSDFYKQITYYSASQFTGPSNCPVSFEVDEKSRPIRTMRSINSRSVVEGHTRWLYDMFIESKDNTKEFTQFLDIVGQSGIGLINRFEFQEIPTSSIVVSVKIGGQVQEVKKERTLIIPKIYIGTSVLSPTQLSEGTFKTLAMIFYLMTGRSKVVLLEEPEVCIHQGLLSSLIELIKQYSKEKQVFISTHSDHILDELDHSNVFVVCNDKSEGIIVNPLEKWMPREDVSALKQFLASEGSLGEYWRSGGFDDIREN